MFLRRDQADELLQAHWRDLVSSLNAHLSFLDELRDGDDWAFVIKAQALIEGAVTQAVLAQIGDQRIQKTVEVLPLIGEEASKLALTKSLGLLTTGQRRFIKRMAALRNRLAHRADSTNFTFGAYVDSLDRDSLRDWQDSIVWFTNTKDSREIWLQLAKSHSRSAIYLGTFLIVALLTIDKSEQEAVRKIEMTVEATIRELLDGLSPAKGA